MIKTKTKTKAKAKADGKTGNSANAPAEGFWDKPPLMNLVADVLFAVSALVLLWAVVISAMRLPLFPLRQVVVASPLHRVTPLQIDYVVHDALNANFFLVNLDAARGSFEKLPWVRRADLRRRWPDTLELNVEEQVAVARWQQRDEESRLVNDRGEVFAAASEEDLPVFTGPEGAAGDVLARYREFTRALQPLGRTLKVVALSPRQAWQLRLDNGLVVELGREDAQHLVAERMARLVAGYAEVTTKLGAPLALADLRYPNGFAVRTAHSN